MLWLQFVRAQVRCLRSCNHSSWGKHCQHHGISLLELCTSALWTNFAIAIADEILFNLNICVTICASYQANKYSELQ